MEQYDETGKVICILCGKPFHQITPQHLRKEHDISIEDFRTKYPDVSLTGLQFRSKQKYKYSTLFEEIAKNVTGEVKIEDIEEFDLDKIPSLPKHFKNIEIKDSVKPLAVTYPNPNNTIHKEKIKILNFLLTIFPNDLQNSYFIEKRSIVGGYLEYRLITDICIPSKKLVFEFPDTFWHNSGQMMYNKYTTLRKDGWNVIEFPGLLPSEEEMKFILKKFKLIS
jgi:hypothetical protein